MSKEFKHHNQFVGKLSKEGKKKGGGIYEVCLDWYISIETCAENLLVPTLSSCKAVIY